MEITSLAQITSCMTLDTSGVTTPRMSIVETDLSAMTAMRTVMVMALPITQPVPAVPHLTMTVGTSRTVQT